MDSQKVIEMLQSAVYPDGYSFDDVTQAWAPSPEITDEDRGGLMFSSGEFAIYHDDGCEAWVVFVTIHSEFAWRPFCNADTLIYQKRPKPPENTPECCHGKVVVAVEVPEGARPADKLRCDLMASLYSAPFVNPDSYITASRILAQHVEAARSTYLRTQREFSTCPVHGVVAGWAWKSTGLFTAEARLTCSGINNE